MKKAFIVKCYNCGKTFEVQEEQQQFPKKEKYYCSRSCANVRHHTEETKKKISNNTKRSEKFINGMKRLFGRKPHETKTSICLVCGKTFEQEQYISNGKTRYTHRKLCSKECRKIYHSLKIVNNCCGGYRECSVKNYKSGWYNDIHCDGSWELAFVIYCIEHNKSIQRCNLIRHYVDKNGKMKTFHPDFIVDGLVYEIKGLQDCNYKEKELCNEDIIFLYKKDMKPYIDYVIEKYGENFISLYDSKDKNDLRYTKQCPTCGKTFINRRTTYCSIRCARLDSSKRKNKQSEVNSV